MAYGDPMVLAPRNLITNGALEVWTDLTAGQQLADGWTLEMSGGHGSTEHRIAGTRTGGSGSYFQELRFDFAGSNGLMATMLQKFPLHGVESLDGNGHANGLTFTFSVWMRKDNAITTDYNIVWVERDKNDAALQTNNTSGSLTTSWVQYSVSDIVRDSDCYYIEVWVQFYRNGGTGEHPQIDDAIFSTTYTFGQNPSIPDRQRITTPRRTFDRGIDGTMRSLRPHLPSAKFEKTLNFGMVNRTTMERLRSIWLLDTELFWTPNHPHLPSILTVRWVNEFDFALVKTLGAEYYKGTAVLAEV